MKIKKNLLNYKNPDTGDYTPIPIIVSGGSGNVELTAKSISDALGYTPANASDLDGKLDIDYNLKGYEGNLLHINHAGKVVVDNDENTFIKYRSKIDIVLNSQTKTGTISIKEPHPYTVTGQNYAIVNVSNHISSPDNHTISYYYLDLYALTTEYAKEQIDYMYNCLHSSTFPRITFEDTYNNVKGSTSNYFIDNYGGLNFIFGMYHVRITTNANNGAQEPV